MLEIHGKPVCETLEEVLARDRCAVVAVDLQNDFVHPDGALARAGTDVAGMTAVVPHCSRFLAMARRLGVRIVYLQHITLPHGQSSSGAWLRATRLISRTSEFTVEGEWGAEICEECAPAPGDLLVQKHRSSGFRDTNLDTLLRAASVETVVVIGTQTPGCVEATYRDALYHDYYNVLIEDCVAAIDSELHDASIKVQKARHDVCLAAEAVAIWERADS